MAKRNCWEVKHCGREPGGAAAAAHGVCPAAQAEALDGINHGTAGGRACWAIAGTLCNGKIQGTFAQKLGSCLTCDFYREVLKTEGKDIASAREIQEALESKRTADGRSAETSELKSASRLRAASVAAPWSIPEGALDQLTCAGARDLIVDCFFETQKETFARAKGKLGAKGGDDLRRTVQAAIRAAFRECGDDFDHPDLASLRRVVETLLRKARSWGTPEDVVSQHKQEIERMLERLR